MIFGRRCEVDEWQHCIIQAAGELFVKTSQEKKMKDEEAGGGREWRAWEEAATERSVYAAGKVCVL